VEDLYDHFEMASPIIISRPKERVVLLGNEFGRNMGLFGGVLTLNAPNWAAGKTPVLVLKDNYYFMQAAYLSGNNIHFRGIIQNEG